MEGPIPGQSLRQFHDPGLHSWCTAGQAGSNHAGTLKLSGVRGFPENWWFPGPDNIPGWPAPG